MQVLVLHICLPFLPANNGTVWANFFFITLENVKKINFYKKKSFKFELFGWRCEPWFRCPAQKEYTLHIQIFEIHRRIWILYRHVEQLMSHWKNSVIIFLIFLSFELWGSCCQSLEMPWFPTMSLLSPASLSFVTVFLTVSSLVQKRFRRSSSFY